MKEQLEVLKEQIASMEREMQEQEAAEFRKGPHKTFKPGDWVTDGEKVGVVEWVENSCCNCPESHGLMGVNLKNGSRGFFAFAKRNDFAYLDPKDRLYYTGEMEISVILSGEEIEALKDILRCQNNHSAITKIRHTLDLISENPNLAEINQPNKQ